ncbi:MULTISPECIES: hypothetical protein [Catenuloplanes]|uniref:Uncharacterized protein n=1 Tax=Catenuloplanes niger TaxID=587534 RepID=A0AAE3ZXS4_9ACTN|nr:hypothetical protein [Catenuloplanes niger]MDR7326781.1 hypothetical protein [Catenuloplanes niger]
MKRNYVAWAALALSLSGLVVGAAPGVATAKGSQVSLGGVRAPEPSGASLRDLSSGKSICVNIQVDKTGWQGWRCGKKGARVTAGAAGTVKKAKAVAITANGVGTLCVKITIQSAPVQTCVSDRTVLVAGSASSGVRLDTLQVKTSGSGLCGNSRSSTAAWASVKCVKAGQWLAIGRGGANAVGLSV